MKVANFKNYICVPILWYVSKLIWYILLINLVYIVKLGEA